METSGDECSPLEETTVVRGQNTAKQNTAKHSRRARERSMRDHSVSFSLFHLSLFNLRDNTLAHGRQRNKPHCTRSAHSQAVLYQISKVPIITITTITITIIIIKINWYNTYHK